MLNSLKPESPKQTTSLKILMVSTEYPPMYGGVGRYTANLTRELKKLGLQVQVLSNENGDGDFFGISPNNTKNYSVLLKLVNEAKPDIVHIQFEHGLYGLKLDRLNPKKTNTNIDLFYDLCKIPIVTTFHTAFDLKQWMNIVTTKNINEKWKVKIYIQKLLQYWTHLLNYKSFNNLNTDKIKKSKRGIVFSQYMKDKVGGGDIIYHGSEPIITFDPTIKAKARTKFSLSHTNRIILALGFRTNTKGWDILDKMDIPIDWTVVMNSSKNHYNTENYIPKISTIHQNEIIDLHKGFLNDSDLSLLFYAADAVILPYKVSSGSGVMFDGLAHGLPFIAADLEFFREFSSKGLGITVKRNPEAFSKALVTLNNNYEYYAKNVILFKEKLKWYNIARNHISLYNQIIEEISVAPTIKRRNSTNLQ
jgi:glycosyltransferase involved in cell wall biosynthesis